MSLLVIAVSMNQQPDPRLLSGLQVRYALTAQARSVDYLARRSKINDTWTIQLAARTRLAAGQNADKKAEMLERQTGCV